MIRRLVMRFLKFWFGYGLPIPWQAEVDGLFNKSAEETALGSGFACGHQDNAHAINLRTGKKYCLPCYNRSGKIRPE